MEKEIEFKDIRVGDAIRREWVQRKLKWTSEGVVTAVYADGLYIEVEGRNTWRYADDVTYILVHRPQPPLPTEPGARIKVTKLDGKSGEWLAKLSRSGSWIVFDLVGDDGAYWVQPFRIDEWVRIEIREVTP